MNLKNQNRITNYSAIVGSIIANYREEQHIGQAEISARLNISQATWSRIERGLTAVNVSQLSEIAELFETTPDEILRRAEKMKQELLSRGIEVEHYRNTDKEKMTLLGATALLGLAALIFSSE